jgi:putative DNA primase/helicase
MSGYGDLAPKYLAGGWEAPLPIPHGRKDPPPKGTTGRDGDWPTAETVAAWCERRPHHNIALWLPDDAIGLDVDEHSRPGATVALVELTGPLPATWCSSARPHPSGIYVYRVPPGLRWKANPVPGVDVIQHTHRYAMVPPSLHPEGMDYGWRVAALTGTPHPVPLDAPPMSALTELPPAAVEELTAPSQPATEESDEPRFREVDSAAQWFTDNHSWAEILEPAGWTLVEGDGESDGSKWRHPRATNEDSASIRHGCLFIYSPNTPFEMTVPGEPHGYTRFAAWSVLAHDGNQSAAARAARDVMRGADGKSTEPSPASGSRYFREGIGLDVVALADDVVGMGPLAEGVDDIMWSYRDGVWLPDRHVVKRRAAELLGPRYRRSHGTNVEDVVRFRVGRIDCEPIPELINFRNGLFDWCRRALVEHTPQVHSTVQLGTDYAPDVACPAFETFLSEVLPADVIELVWELIGYLMYSGNPLHKAVMLVGTGNNGKGTFLRVMLRLLGGKRNVTSASLYDLTNTRFATASLFGKLANIAGDVDGRYLENTAIFKAITGGDAISAEHKGRDRFDFTPWAVPVFSANKVPASADTTVGYLRRWLIVPFPNDFTGREDRTLDAKLQHPAELRGIAARALAALPRLLDRGDFELTESASSAREQFVRHVDQVRRWVDECCSIGPEHGEVPRAQLYDQYKAWAERSRHRPVSASEFYDRLDAIDPGGYPHPKIVRGTRLYEGIKALRG